MTTEDLLEHYLSNEGGFSILVLGPKGIGKTSSVARLVKKLEAESTSRRRSVGQKADSSIAKLPFIPFNCAAFEDGLAESALFGYVPGAFTGGLKDGAKGFFSEAENGVLLFDEVHALSKRVQQKLMTALQTESEGENQGKFPILPLGASRPTYVKVRPVFATNVSLGELRKALLPDFYDRISQLVVEFPPMPKGVAHRMKAFQTVWSKMQFIYPTGLSHNERESKPHPQSKEFKDWLKGQHLEGNYRDLDTIAILWDQAYRMGLSDAKSLAFVKEHFEGWHSAVEPASEGPRNFNFAIGRSYWDMLDEYRFELVKWARQQYGSDSAAEEALDISRIGARIPRKYRSK